MKIFLSLMLSILMIMSVVFSFAACSKDDNTLTCGVTIFENMNEKDVNGNWTGFESEFAMEGGKLIVKVARNGSFDTPSRV